MVKKIFALVMVISVLGVFVAGCSKPEETTAPAADAKAAPAADAKAGDAAKTP